MSLVRARSDWGVTAAAGAAFAGAVQKNAEILQLCTKRSQFFVKSSGYHSFPFLLPRLSPSSVPPLLVPGVEQAQDTTAASAPKLLGQGKRNSSWGEFDVLKAVSACLSYLESSLSSQCHLGVQFAFQQSRVFLGFCLIPWLNGVEFRAWSVPLTLCGVCSCVQLGLADAPF